LVPGPPAANRNGELKSTGMSRRRGRFITFEGGEGSGKSTQAHLLGDRLRAAGRDVVVTREPGGTPVGEQIREIFLGSGDDPIASTTEALLMSAARAEHVAKVIEPALAAGSWIISDRYIDSTYAYQGGGRGLPVRQLQKIQELATGLLLPDLTFLLDLPVTSGLERRKRIASTNNRLDAETVAFHERVRSGYHSLVAVDPVRWIVVDGTQPIEAIASTIWREVSSRFGAWLEADAAINQVT